MRQISPGVHGLMQPWSRQPFWHWSSWVPAPGKKKKKEAAPPKVQETVGDLSFVVSRGEWKVEGVGLVRGPGQHRASTRRRPGIASNSSTR